MVTFNVECNRSLSGPLVSTNCTHVHPIVTDCGIRDVKGSFDDGISSARKRTFFFRPRNCCDNVFLGRTLKCGGRTNVDSVDTRCHYNPRGRNNTPRLPLDRLQGSQSS